MVFCRSLVVKGANASDKHFQPAFHLPNNSSLVTKSFWNSESRSRQGFSPSVVRKSVNRESILPDKCFTMDPMLLLSGLYCQNNLSSGICCIALSPSILYW